MSLSSTDVSLIQSFMSENITGVEAMPGRLIYKKLRKQLSVALEEPQFLLQLSGLVRNGDITGFEGRRRLGYIVVGSRPKPEPKPKSSKPVGQEESEEEDVGSADTDPAPPAPATLPEPSTEPAPPPEPEPTKPEPEPEPEPEPTEPTPEPKSVVRSIRVRGIENGQPLRIAVPGGIYSVPMAPIDVRALLSQVVQATPSDSGAIEYRGERYTCDTKSLKMLERLLLCFFESTLTVTGRSAA
jgi:hypothetical protein